MSECQNCAAPGGYPYCNDDCRDAATAPETGTISPAGNEPLTHTTDPWASDARNYL